MSTAEQAARKPRGPAPVADAGVYGKLEDIEGKLLPIGMAASEIKKNTERGVFVGVLKAFAVIVLLAPLWMIVVIIYWAILGSALGGLLSM